MAGYTLRRRGAPLKFETAEALETACESYIRWVQENPLIEARVFHNSGEIVGASLPKMRAMSITALCRHIGITHECWRKWRTERPDLVGIIARVESLIWDQQYEGAAADLLNQSIVARKLGLADRQEHTGRDGAPIETLTTVEMSDDEIVRRIAFAMRKGLEAAKNPQIADTGGEPPSNKAMKQKDSEQ